MPSIHNIRLSMQESQRYAVLADEAMSRCDALVLNGHNCSMRVSNKSLHIKQGSLIGVEREPIVYSKGVVPVKTIIILSSSGNISLEAFHWCKEQNISLLMLNGMGNVLYSMTPESESNAKLRRLQYHASDTGRDILIAQELIRKE